MAGNRAMTSIVTSTSQHSNTSTPRQDKSEPNDNHPPSPSIPLQRKTTGGQRCTNRATVNCHKQDSPQARHYPLKLDLLDEVNFT